MNDLLMQFQENFFDLGQFATLLVRFILNAVVVWVVIDRIYLQINKQREYLFTFYIINILIFFVSSVLSVVKMETGFAFGLFAIFSIIRYRTEPINIKEMTFMFVCIIIAVLNSLVTSQVAFVNIIFADVIIIVSAYILERRWLQTYNHSMAITYENITMIHEDKHSELCKDLELRTGKKVLDCDVVRINYLRDTAEIVVYYE